MSWAKMDDGWAWHPKLREAGLEASGLDARAWSYCARYETDGFVPDHAVVDLADGNPKKAHQLAKMLVGVRRWERDEPRDGYVVHDYLVYNSSKADLERKREAERQKKAAQRKKGSAGVDNGPGGRFVPSPVPGDDAPGHPPGQYEGRPPGVPGGVHRYPVPSRPIVDQSPPPNPGVAPAVAEEEEIRDRYEPENHPAVREIVGAVAQRRLARRAGEPITNRQAWLRRVAGDVAAEHARTIAEMLATGATPDQCLAAVDPEPSLSPTVERKPCCGTTAGQPHRFGCDAEAERLAAQA